MFVDFLPYSCIISIYTSEKVDDDDDDDPHLNCKFILMEKIRKKVLYFF